MLYDYLAGELDDERRAAVEACIESDSETRAERDALKAGLACAEALSLAEPAPEFVEALGRAEYAASLGRKFARWSNWPETLRWSLIAVGVSCVVAFAFTFAPKRFLTFGSSHPDTVELAPLGGPADVAQNVAESDSEKSDDAEAGSAADAGDASGDEDESAAAAPSPNAKPSPRAEAPPPPPAPAEGAPPDEQAEAGASAPEPASKSESKPKGFVCRAWLSASNVETATPKIVDAIHELGGEKAGEVELGWKRGAGSYFHFSLPSKNEQEILDRLKAYGRVRISKDPHPRVMPAGQVRFILWVETAR